MLQVSVLAKSVIHSLQISSSSFFFLFVHFEVSATSPHLGVKSTQWWHYQETGVQYDDYRLGSWWSKFEQKGKEKKNYVLCCWGQVLYLYPYRCFLSSKLMPPQPFSTLYIILCSLSLHPPRIHKTETKKKKKKVTLRSGWLPVCERCKCFSILLNYWNKPKIDVKRWKGMWLKKIMCF